MTGGRVAGALGVGAAAACCCLAALSGGRATAVGALGIAPDARGTPPPEYAFVRKARRAFGAALMRASYHQTASDGGAATAEEADALADAEAMADIEDKDFTRGGDYLSSSSSMATTDAFLGLLMPTIFLALLTYDLRTSTVCFVDYVCCL